MLSKNCVRLFIIVTVCTCSSTITIIGQANIGLNVGRFTGMQGAILNPANNVNSPLIWDINLVSAGVHFQNNYAFLQNTNLPDLLRNYDDIERISTTVEAPNASDALLLDFFDNTSKRFAYFNSELMGPSFRMSKNDWSFGVFIRARSSIGGSRIPANLGYYDFLRQDFYQNFEATPFAISGAVWAEGGVNVAKEIHYDGYSSLALGVTLKYIAPFAAFYFVNHDTQVLSRAVNDTLLFQVGNVSYAYAGPSVANSANNNNDNMRSIGHGAAADIGLTYTLGHDPVDYKLKVGIALLDIGKMWLRQNAQQHTINTQEALDIYTEEFTNIENEQEFFDLLSNESLQAGLATFVSSTFNMWMPGALSLQADLAITKALYVNATMLRRLSFGGRSLQRPNLLALTPRLETRFLAVSLPLLLYNDRDFLLGAAVKFDPIILGSDNIMSIVRRQSTFMGSDVYVALKINSFELNKTAGSKKRTQNCKRIKNSGQGQCYRF